MTKRARQLASQSQGPPLGYSSRFSPPKYLQRPPSNSFSPILEEGKGKNPRSNAFPDSTTRSSEGCRCFCQVILKLIAVFFALYHHPPSIGRSAGRRGGGGRGEEEGEGGVLCVFAERRSKLIITVF